jgi:outer membrane protein assembly factor BamA
MIKLYLYIILLIPINLYSASNITSTNIITDARMSDLLRRELENYMQTFNNKKISAKIIYDAQDFLNRLYFVASSRCEIEKNNFTCYITPKLRISNIVINNLPASLLESELLRKLPLQRGQFTSFDDKTIGEAQDLTRSRVKTYLRKVGFYGAEVEVAFVSSAKALEFVCHINIKRGDFALVNDVSVKGLFPLSSRSVSQHFQRMCLSFRGLFDALSIGTFKCYSRELEREATDDLQERLARLGYVRARIRVQHEWLDPHGADTPSNCRKHDPKDTQARCVDLHIEIDQGPRVRWNIHMFESSSVSRNALSRFFGSVLAVENFSRATLSDTSNSKPEDQVIIKQDLEKQINFIEAKNIDEQELNRSAQRMTEYLIRRGYANAEVLASYVQEDPDNIVVNFDVYSGRTYYIRSVKIRPEKYVKYIHSDVLSNLVKSRSFFASGHIDNADLNFAKQELIRLLGDKGFTNITSNLSLTASDNGAVDAVFYFDSSDREIVDEIEIINGFEDLNSQVISTLKNCDNYEPDQVKACADSSFLADQVSSDEARLIEFYQAHDYIYAGVKSEVVTNKNKHKIIFHIFDTRFPDNLDKKLYKQTIHNLIISGNASTNKEVIRRLFPRGEASRFDSLSLRKGLANLRESGRFSRIDHKLMSARENSDKLYFSLQLIERPSLILDTSIGFSTDQHLVLETELEETNLFSSMLTLKTKLALGLFWGRQSSINNKLIWPFIWGKPFVFTLHAPIIIYDDKSHRDKPYKFRRLQSKIIAGLDWRVNVNLLPYIKYYLIHIKEDEDPKSLNAKEKFTTLDGLITTFKKPGKINGVLKPGISYINIDNPFDPRSGVDTHNWVEISTAPFEGATNFVNFGTQNRFYLPLGPCTLAMQFSFMRAFITPNEENFKQLRNHSSMDRLGGDRTVRGYKEGNIGITGEIKNSKNKFSGYFSNLINLEFRFPLNNSPTTWTNFMGAIFADQGLLVPCDNFFSLAPGLTFKQIINQRGFGLSLGAGIRYILPVGPISFDYAISPIHKDGSWHLQFGYAF